MEYPTIPQDAKALLGQEFFPCILFNLSGEVVSSNQEAEKLLKISDAPLLFLQKLSSEDRSRFLHGLSEVSGKPEAKTCCVLEYPTQATPSSSILLDLRAMQEAPLVFAMPKILHTEHARQTEEKVKASEGLLQPIIRAMAEGVVVQNQQFEIIACNPAAEEILGLTKGIFYFCQKRPNLF